MIPVYSPNLPTEKVSAAVVGSVDPRVIRSLEALGVWTIAAGPNRSLPAALCRHADMLVHPLGNGEGKAGFAMRSAVLVLPLLF